MKRTRIFPTAIVVAALLACGCASSLNANTEKARFALDNADWDAAIAYANDALSSDPGDIDAALLLSSAYSGKAGLTVLSVASDLSGADAGSNLFETIHTNFVASVSSLDALRSSIESLTLTTMPDAENPYYTDLYFQRGLLDMIEGFVMPTLRAQPTIDGTITPADITAADATNVMEDFINADNDLINSGMDATDELVVNIRKYYCVLENASAGSGFTRADLQDMVYCQLAADPTVVPAAGFQSVANCAAFNFAACAAAGNTD